MNESKHATSFRLSADCLQLLQRLAAAYGISQAAVIEIAVRGLARGWLTPTDIETPTNTPTDQQEETVP